MGRIFTYEGGVVFAEKNIVDNTEEPKVHFPIPTDRPVKPDDLHEGVLWYDRTDDTFGFKKNGEAHRIQLYKNKSDVPMDDELFYIDTRRGVRYFPAMKPEYVVDKNRIQFYVNDSKGNKKAILDSNERNHAVIQRFSDFEIEDTYYPFGLSISLYGSNGQNGFPGNDGYATHSYNQYYNLYKGNGGSGGNTGVCTLLEIANETDSTKYCAPAGGGGGGGGNCDYGDRHTDSTNTSHYPGTGGLGGLGGKGTFGEWSIDKGYYNIQVKFTSAQGNSVTSYTGGTGGSNQDVYIYNVGEDGNAGNPGFCKSHTSSTVKTDGGLGGKGSQQNLPIDINYGYEENDSNIYQCIIEYDYI